MGRLGQSSQLGYPDIRTKPAWIYALVESDTGEVRYIGRAQNPRQRLLGHLRASENRHVYPWVLQLYARGAQVAMLLLREVPPGTDVDAAEREELAKRFGIARLLNVHLWSDQGRRCNVRRMRAARDSVRGGDGYVSPDLDASSAHLDEA